MFEGLDNTQTVFWVCAIFGTSFFVIKSVLSLFLGIGADIDSDIGGHDFTHEGSGGPDAAFKTLSITSLTTFFMMFGWVGLASYEQAKFGSSISILLAFISGIISMYFIAMLFKAAFKLTSRGAVFDLSKAVGVKANVYQKIPAQGKGRIQLALADTTHEIDAISEDGVEIASFSNVEVIRVVNNETLSVKVSK